MMCENNFQNETKRETWIIFGSVDFTQRSACMVIGLSVRKEGDIDFFCVEQDENVTTRPKLCARRLQNFIYNFSQIQIVSTNK